MSDATSPARDQTSMPGITAATRDQTELREQAHKLLERLIETYPQAFFPAEARRIPPLKLGIHKDLSPTIREWGYSVTILRITLSNYTRRLRYQMALAKAPQRLDLQGQPAGEISETHRQVAQQRIQVIQEKRKQREPEKTRPRPKKKAPSPSPPPKSEGVSLEAFAALQAKLTGKANP